MNASIDCSIKATHVAPETLLGNNLDGCSFTMPALLSDRLDNPKFLGPADPVTGIAAGWGSHARNEQGARYALVPGMGLSGREAQLLHAYGGDCASISQIGRRVQANERLEVELWAMAVDQPVKVRVGIKPWPSRQPAYDTAEIEVDASYWKPYRAELTAPRDDDDAVFFCRFGAPGKLWLDQVHLRPAGEGDLNRDLLERVRALRLPLLRFPGSCVSTIYRWRYGTGPRHLRPVEPDPVFGWRMDYDFGTDEYLDLCLDQGIRPHLVVNIGRGTPEEAAEWAAYCRAWFVGRGVEPPAAIFNMGNEQHGIFESSHMTGRMYAAALRAFVPGIRRAYPGARILAIGEAMSGGLRPEDRTPWRPAVLAEAKGFFDILGIHCYPGKWEDEPGARMADTVASVAAVERALRALAEDVRPHGDGIRLALDEWNCWLHAGHDDGKGFLEPGDTRHSLFAARMLHMLAGFGPELELAAFYQLVNPMGVFRCSGGRVEEAGMAEILRLYRPAFPGEVFPVAVDAPELGKGKVVDALRMRNKEGDWLFLVNSSPVEAVEARLDALRGMPREAICLAGAEPAAALERRDVAVTRNGVTLPPLSVVRVR